jgi:hypothetical protein
VPDEGDGSKSGHLQECRTLINGGSICLLKNGMETSENHEVDIAHHQGGMFF